MALSHLPWEVLDEIAIMLLPEQKADEDRLRLNLPWLPSIGKKQVDLIGFTSSTGTTASMVSRIIEVAPEGASWVKEATEPLKGLAERREERGIVGDGLREVEPYLAAYFEKAQASFEKAKAGNLGIDQAATRMRSVVQ
jgi:hypothetical protein